MKNERGTGKSERGRGDETDPLVLSDIVEVPAIQSMMDDFFGLTNIGVAILDIKGKVLVATGWQDICTKFHRVHSETSRHCVESDTRLSMGVKPGTFKIYRCKNHMWDMATPITAGGQHVGNLFLGQFLFADEEPDYGLFREQARKYGFDEREYLSALDRVPRWEKEKVNRVMTFYSKLARLISDLSYANLRLARTLKERNTLFHSLQKREEQYRTLVQSSNDILWAFDMASQNFTFASDALERILGYPMYPMDTAPNMTIDDVFSSETKKEVMAAFGEAGRRGRPEGRVVVVAEHRHQNGRFVWMEISARAIKNADGKIVGFAGVTRDISERKRAEAERQQREEELQWLFKRMFNAFVLFESVFDSDGRFISYRFVRINEAYERITGVKNEEVKGKTVHEVWPETEP
jgi:PAS domain S-box-containing protein